MAECRGMDSRNSVLQVTWFQHPGWSTRVWRLGRVMIAVLVATMVNNARALYGIQPRRTFHRFAGEEVSGPCEEAVFG